MIGRSLGISVTALLIAAGTAIGAEQDPPRVDPVESVPFDRAEPLPDDLEGVGITEHGGDMIPLDATFRDEKGKTVTMGDLLDDGVPVILNIGYYRCPMLCGLVWNGLIDALEELPLEMGKDYTVITLSVDPAETHTLAYLKKKSVAEAMGGTFRPASWRFLTGTEDEIRRLTDAVGFGYQWNERRGEYAHAAAITLLTPEGVISRYLYGIRYPSSTLRLSLVEAAEGKIGTPLDQILLFCFQYDASSGRYAPAARNLMRLAGVGTLAALASFMGISLFREFRRRRQEEEGALA